ncbi:SRPBCC domain-containing protein [Saccharomonospora xinjiangensis]|uniref:SRPBCC domain-containing protein n=1 Tax=Saccharomonospora xinjiangensis TaxID=75294 RepID=UPI00350FE3F9
MIDIADRLTATYREVRTTTDVGALEQTEQPRPGTDAAEYGLVLRRRFSCPPATAWSAMTEVENLARWLAPVTGETHVGGTFRVADHAEGTVLDCAAPHLFAVTWGGETEVVTVRLAEDEAGDTVVELVHTGVPRDGAVRHGPGWDVAIAGLERFLAGETEPEPGTWRASTSVQTFAQHSVSAWVKATEVSGVATAEELADAAGDCLRRLAPDLTRPATA